MLVAEVVLVFTVVEATETLGAGLQKLHAEGYEHSHRLSERSEPSQAEVSSARVARLKFQPFSLEIDVPNVKSSSP